MDMDHDACYAIISQRDARFDGRLFTGVKTTGIYCRPVCPARTPLSKNVSFFPTAAAVLISGSTARRFLTASFWAKSWSRKRWNRWL